MPRGNEEESNVIENLRDIGIGSKWQIPSLWALERLLTPEQLIAPSLEESTCKESGEENSDSKLIIDKHQAEKERETTANSVLS
jgi:hypothetical protein